MSTDDVLFQDRAEAGVRLGAAVRDLLGADDAVVLGLARGGVPVAARVAAALSASLDVFVVRKLGSPGNPELAFGAIATGGVRVLNDAVMTRAGVTASALEQVTARETAELARRERAYRGDRPALRLAGRTVVLVDDGLATGATMLAAVEAVRASSPRRVVVAVPVGASEACARVRTEPLMVVNAGRPLPGPEAVARIPRSPAYDVVCLHEPSDFRAVGPYYADFTQTTDEQVQQLLST